MTPTAQLLYSGTAAHSLSLRTCSNSLIHNIALTCKIVINSQQNSNDMLCLKQLDDCSLIYKKTRWARRPRQTPTATPAAAPARASPGIAWFGAFAPAGAPPGIAWFGAFTHALASPGITQFGALAWTLASPGITRFWAFTQALASPGVARFWAFAHTFWALRPIQPNIKCQQTREVSK